MPVYDAPDYSIDFNKTLGGALASIPEQIIGKGGTPDLTDPMSTYKYLEKRRETIIDSVRQRPLLRLWDKDHRSTSARSPPEKSVMVEEVMTDSGSGTIAIRRDNWLSDFILLDRRMEEDVHVTLDPIATKTGWESRWGGKMINCNAKRDSSGLHSVELELLSNREHAKHVLAGANPISPPEVQLPKAWILPWNCRTAMMITWFINLARQFFPFLAIPTNIANPGAWLSGTGILQGLNPLSWPIQPQYINPIFDQSRFTVLTSRWQDMHTISGPILADAGCMMRAYTWLPEDKTSPHPELRLGLKELPFIGDIIAEIGEKTGIPTDLDELIRPTRPAIIMATEDKSGVTGLTGTLLDGPINLVAATLDDLITEQLASVVDLDNDFDEGKTDPFFRKLLGAAPSRPWPVFLDGEYSAITESQHTLHSSTAKTIMVGSKSPGWVNQLQTFLIKWGLSQISYSIQLYIGGVTADEVTAPEIPATPGLEEIYQGQLDDCVSRDTKVEGPDGVWRIDKLAEHGGPFRVWSITPTGKRVAATAVFAFKKGTADLFAYTLANGRSITVTGDHRFLTDTGFVRAHTIEVGSRIALSDGGFSPVVNIEFVGVDDFYDMHVPGWENYAAEGMWHHNTLLAWQRYTDLTRAIRAGDFGFLEHFEQGSGSAYTVSGVLDIRTGQWKTQALQQLQGRRPQRGTAAAQRGLRARRPNAVPDGQRVPRRPALLLEVRVGSRNADHRRPDHRQAR